MGRFIKNYGSTMLFILGAYWFYTHNPYYIDFFDRHLSFAFSSFQISVITIFKLVITLYVIFLIPYYLYYTAPSKALIVLGYLKKVLSGNNTQSQTERTALLVWFVKIFWAPLMVSWLSGHIFDMTNNLYKAYTNASQFSIDFFTFFDTYFFWTAFTIILFMDVFFFTIGYLVEAPFLKNTIKSVEPTVIGWIVAIICYPPLNSTMGELIGWYSTDFPSFANQYIHVTANISILFLMAIYSRASLALGFKASNLTNRGIVSHGPYKYVRHPAYICKNLAWIIGGFPMIYMALDNGSTNIFAVLFGLSGWALIYYMRAITEENHLSTDPDYKKYKQQVKWKFIPKVW